MSSLILLYITSRDAAPSLDAEGGLKASLSAPPFLPPAGFDQEGQVAIGISHWKRPYPLMCQALPSPDGVQSEAAAFPCLTEHAEPVSCPASLSITPLPSHCSSQDTISDSSTSK